MPAAALSHPDRLAATLANLAAAHAARPGGDFPVPEPGAADCRIDVKLLAWRALRAAERSPAAAAHLRAYDPARHPDLWAGTVRDGVARGFQVRLEEAIALAPPEPARFVLPTDARVVVGRDLRKLRDILIASAGPRLRFTRKAGVTYVDRDDARHSTNCLWFEARRDLGTLDGFRADAAERPRLFSAQFLRPERLTDDGDRTELCLSGRLGRGPIGWRCQVLLRGDRSVPGLDVVIELHELQPGWRVRCRWLGLTPEALTHECTPVREVVTNERGGFVADTLVRSCTRLAVDGVVVDVPGGACTVPIVPRFHIGSAASG